MPVSAVVDIEPNAAARVRSVLQIVDDQSWLQSIADKQPCGVIFYLDAHRRPFARTQVDVRTRIGPVPRGGGEQSRNLDTRNTALSDCAELGPPHGRWSGARKCPRWQRTHHLSGPETPPQRTRALLEVRREVGYRQVRSRWCRYESQSWARKQRCLCPEQRPRQGGEPRAPDCPGNRPPSPRRFVPQPVPRHRGGERTRALPKKTRQSRLMRPQCKQ